MSSRALILATVLLLVGWCAPALAQEKVDTGIAVLTGEWRIDYTHDAVRTYVIEKNGKVSATAGVVAS